MKIKLQKPMHKFLNYIILFSTTVLMAQQTRVTGSIDASTIEDGLHKIEIPSMIRSYAAGDLRDFRIFNSAGEQVPYFAHRDANETQVSDFIPFSIVSQSRIPDSSSTYIFKNSGAELKKVVLSIANYDGSKKIRLEGSNDQKKWFGLVNSRHLYNLKSTTRTRVYSILDFPLTSYRYIKIVFDDRYTLPVNLLKIGTATNTITKATLTPIAVQEQTITELSKEKKTKIHVRFEHPQVIHQIRFKVSAPEFYNRKVRLYTLASRMVKNNTEMYQKRLTNFTLRADGAHQFAVDVSFEKELYIEIENQDNPKLQLTEIEFLQEPLYVVANLKKGEKYQISAGDKIRTAPSYDLSYFKNRISNDLPKATITNVKYDTPEDTTAIKDDSFWQQPWFMWSCIGLAGALIAYFASSLIKDLKEDHQE